MRSLRCRRLLSPSLRLREDRFSLRPRLSDRRDPAARLAPALPAGRARPSWVSSKEPDLASRSSLFWLDLRRRRRGRDSFSFGRRSGSAGGFLKRKRPPSGRIPRRVSGCWRNRRGERPVLPSDGSGSRLLAIPAVGGAGPGDHPAVSLSYPGQVVCPQNRRPARGREGAG